MIRSIVSLLVSISLFVACSKSANKTAQGPRSGNNPEASVIKPANGPYQPTETQYFDLLHTRLEVTPDWSKEQLNGVAELTLKPYFYPQDSLIIDAKGMDLHSIDLIRPQSLALKYSYDGKKIRIRCDKRYTSRDTLTIRISYTAKPNELPKGGSAAITQDKGLYFINANGKDSLVPRQLWTQGETVASSCWFPTIDIPNEKTTQEMYITVDTNYTVLSNGEFIYSRKNSGGTKTDYWRMDQPHAPYLFMMAIGDFVITKDHWRDREVNYYMEPKYAPYARAVFGNTPEMIEFYSNKLGVDYPWSKYSQVVVRDFVSGAMENTTATVHFEGLNCDDRQMLDEYWDGIITHELFHHWFGDYVTCESWANLPLNESFANYSEYLWAEYKYGIDEADRLAQKEEDEYFAEATEKQEPLIRYHYHQRDDMFDAHSYNKGGRVLHMLRKYVGDEAFFKSLNLYLTSNAFKTAEVSDLRKAFEVTTGEDLNWFFDEWFMSPGHPQLDVAHSYQNGKLTIQVKQVQDTTYTPVYRFPVHIDVWTSGVKVTHLVWIDSQTEVIELPSSVAPQLVLFDSENYLLAQVRHAKSDSELAFQYDHYADRYFARYNALVRMFTLPDGNPKVTADFASNSYRRAYMKKAINDDFWLIREYALSQFSRYYISNLVDYIGDMKRIAMSDSKPVVRARAIYLLSDISNSEFRNVFEEGLKAKPYSVVAASLDAYLKAEEADSKVIISQFESSEIPDIVIILAEYYLQQKDLSKFSWFKVRITHTPDRELYLMTHIFGQYAQLLEDQQRVEAKKILTEIAENNHYDVIRKLAASYAKSL